MCYSSQIRAEYKKYVRLFGADISIKEYFDIYWRRLGEPESRIKIPKAMDFDFNDPQSDEEREIKGIIDEFNRRQTSESEQELFKQRKRLGRRASRASHDFKFPGTYNARRDNLEGFWKGQFGHTHDEHQLAA